MSDSYLNDIESEDAQKLLSAIIEVTLKKVYLHPVRFELVWSAFDDHNIAEIEERFRSCFEDCKIKSTSDSINKYVDIIEGLSWDTVLFREKALSICSEQTGSSDRCGGGCGEMKIPLEEFQWATDCPDGVTVKNLTEAVYRMKGSKYDWWYELFSSITFRAAYDLVKCEVSFDYGS